MYLGGARPLVAHKSSILSINIFKDDLLGL